jgi:hypothetical protein
VSSAVATSCDPRGRDADDGTCGERDDADAELLRHRIDERLGGDTRRVEPRRLDVLRLHRARAVDREDDRRLLRGTFTVACGRATPTIRNTSATSNVSGGR